MLEMLSAVICPNCSLLVDSIRRIAFFDPHS